MKIDFTGRSALVTGGTRGIGRAIAHALLEAGAKVIITGTQAEPSERLHTEFGTSGRWSYAGVDFLVEYATEQFAERIAGERIDILVNNAGINRLARVGDLAPNDWDDVQRVNVRAPMLLTRALAPGMAERGYGRIVNVSSIFGHVTRALRVSYTTSKFAILGLTRTTAVDYAARNVLCNAVAPGFVNTDLTRRILSEAQRAELAASTPLGRLGEPEEIARVIMFLASDANTFITGQLLIADGGFTIV